MVAPLPSLMLQPLPRRGKTRWIVPGVMALALHLLLLFAIERGTSLASVADAARHLRDLPREPVTVSLVPTPPAPEPARVSTAKPAAAARKPRAAAAAATLPVTEPDSRVPAAEILMPPLPVPEIVTAALAVAPPASKEPPAVEPEPAGYRFSAPPSVTLKYDVERAEPDGQNVYGNGTISWQVDGARYRIDGDAGVLFISALSFSSEGVLDEHGVAPEKYREKRFRKAEINTHFSRERALISFSASEKTYPRQGGEQDRASIIWQLAGIGRGDSDRITTGAEIPVFVAGIRDGEIWTMRVIGEEEIATGAGKTRSWHFLRTPKPGSFEQTIDLWLAPQFDWYPVRLRQTDANGAWLDMTMSGMRRAPTPKQ